MKKTALFLVLCLAGTTAFAGAVASRRAEWSDVGANMLPRSDADVPAGISDAQLQFMKAFKAFETAAQHSPGAPADVSTRLYPVQTLIAKNDLAGAAQALDQFAAQHAGLGIVDANGQTLPVNTWVRQVKNGFIPS
jgi:hypothetical protein